MSLIGYALALARGYYDIVRAIRICSIRDYEKSLMSMGKEEKVFTRQGFDGREIKQRQDRDGSKGRTKTCQYQKPLLIRINKDIKGIEEKIEADIQEAFSREIRSRRWHKRHHFAYNLLGQEIFRK
jgi:hypothetical protein